MTHGVMACAGFRDVNLSAVTASVADAYRPEAEEAGYHLTAGMAPGIVVHADQELLPQALANVMENALRHTPAGTRAWFRICPFWVTQGAQKPPACEGRGRLEGCSVQEAASLPGSSSPGLKRSQAQQGEPMRMARACHQFPWALAIAFGTSAAHEAAMVQEEPQQIQVRVAQVAA